MGQHGENVIQVTPFGSPFGRRREPKLGDLPEDPSYCPHVFSDPEDRSSTY